jgi:hypothetical protein
MNRAAPVVAVAFTLVALSGFAQETQRPTVWIDPASQGASYLQAAAQKKHTPVSFITDKDSASQIATLQVEGKDGSTAKAVLIGPAFSGAERNMVLTVIDAKSYTVVFSYTCEKHGEGANFQSAAECLAKHWGDFLEKGKP